MLILLSPAKSLDFETAVSTVTTKNSTSPRFPAHAAQIMSSLRARSAAELSTLMSLSEALGELNFQRNQQWQAEPAEAATKPAVYAFQGDVYKGLAVDELTTTEVKRCQKHVRILSGLYGILRPLDQIQPYRLEMGTALANERGANLYEFWGDTVRDAIAEELMAMKSRLVVNLASQEYARVAKLKSLDADIVTPDFRDWKNGKFKVISFFAKRARGLMTRYLITNAITKPAGLINFDLDGYTYDGELSTETAPVFTRRFPATTPTA